MRTALIPHPLRPGYRKLCHTRDQTRPEPEDVWGDGRTENRYGSEVNGRPFP